MFLLPAGRGGRLSPYPGASALGPERLLGHQAFPCLASPSLQHPDPAPARWGGWRRRKLGGPKFSGAGCMNQEGQAPLKYERDHLAERCQERRGCAWGQAYLPVGLAWELRRSQRNLNHHSVTSPGALLLGRDGRRAFLTQNL